MAADYEIELKLLVDPDDCARLLDLDWVRAAEPAALPLSATYSIPPTVRWRRRASLCACATRVAASSRR